MIPPTFTKEEYLEVMFKAQAVQICGDRDPACDTRGIHDALVAIYSAKMMRNDGTVAQLIGELNVTLDEKLQDSNPVTRTEVYRCMTGLHDDSWMQNKMEEMNSKLSRIMEALDSKTAVTHPSGSSVKPLTNMSVRASIAPVQKSLGKYLKVTEDGMKECRDCRKLLSTTDFSCDKNGHPSSARCKVCTSAKNTNLSPTEYREFLKFIKDVVMESKVGSRFSTAEIAKLVTDTSPNSTVTKNAIASLVSEGKIERIKTGGAYLYVRSF